jgi:hypothetical protein
MNKNYFKKILPVVFAAIIFVFPYYASAQSISLTSAKTSYQTGEYTSVFLVLDTNNAAVNTIGATIQVPQDFFEISSMLTGNSILSLWPEMPKAHDDGSITFLGGVPGGFTGPKGSILTLVLKTKKSGQATIGIKDVSVLLNDGLGTELKGVKLNPLTLDISSQIKKEEAKPLADTVPPEPFTPVISRNISVADNKYFVSFSAQDRGSGIAYYQIREGYTILPFLSPFSFTGWQKTENPPYILNLQHWWSKVYVRAYDNAGNYREEAVLKPIDKQGKAILYVSLIVILIIIILLFFIKKFRKK